MHTPGPCPEEPYPNTPAIFCMQTLHYCKVASTVGRQARTSQYIQCRLKYCSCIIRATYRSSTLLSTKHLLHPCVTIPKHALLPAALSLSHCCTSVQQRLQQVSTP